MFPVTIEVEPVKIVGLFENEVTRGRPPGVSLTTFAAHPPNLQPRPLVDMDFAIICPLVRPRLPHIRFLSVKSRLCYTLPSDPTSR
jgi:hypothetical protein